MNKSKAGPMKPQTIARLVNRAAWYLEREAREYRLDAKLDGPDYAAFCGKRAAQLTAAARTLRGLRFK